MDLLSAIEASTTKQAGIQLKYTFYLATLEEDGQTYFHKRTKPGKMQCFHPETELYLSTQWRPIAPKPTVL